MEALAAHRLAAVAVVVAAALGPAATAARADGDPASDVLISQGVFFPYYVKIPPATQDELKKTVADAKDSGYTVRAALIGHAYDLGSATPLWRMPQAYAKFLAQELANFNTGWVLTVMPNGYGIFHCVPKKRKGGYSDPCEGARPSARDRRLLASLPPPGNGPGIAAATDTAVRRLAALHGVEVKEGGGGGNSLGLVLGGVGAGAVVVAAAVVGLLVRRRRRPGVQPP